MQRSGLYETEPQEVTAQPWFLNMAVRCETELAPLALLRTLLSVELELGRDRSADALPKGPRVIDIDILLYDQAVIELPELTVPHPGLLRRRFVLEPLLEVNRQLAHPAFGTLLADALPTVADQSLRRLT